MSEKDSSDEDNADLLREAADNQFFNDSMFKESGKTVPADVKKPRSRRPDRKQDDPNVLGVTPDFQNHVARHLMKLLDSQICEVTATDEEVVGSRKAQEDGGVRLLGTSKVLLSVEEEPSEKQKRPKPVKKGLKVDDDRSEKERLSEAAVSADWILSQEATKGWAKNTKGEIITVKNSEVQNTGVKWMEYRGKEMGYSSRGVDEEEGKRKNERRKGDSKK